MHIQTHILSGWCAADCLDMTPRERLFAMVAASAADLDGLGIIVSIEYYAKYHHVLAHNVFFGGLLAVVLTAFSTHRIKAFFLFLFLFHLHLVLDYLGSGLGWGIHYLWPLSQDEILNPNAWELVSWQNIATTVVLLAWTFGIAIKKCRTPLEAIMPALDQKLVMAFRRQQ